MAARKRQRGAGPEAPRRPGPSAEKRRRRMLKPRGARPGPVRAAAKKRPRRRSEVRQDLAERPGDAGMQAESTKERPGGTGERRGTAVPSGQPVAATAPVRGLNRRQREKKRRLKEPPSTETPSEPGDRSAALRARMEQRLLGARFRYLNEQLYSRSSREAAQLLRSDPEAFALYHRGFAQQVQHWPQHPADSIISYLRRRPASLVVADFGCGDCRVARGVRNKVYCFDLLPLCPRVTVCDMAQVPLPDHSVDVAVFCLSLMGTNLHEILAEANRVLRTGGTLLVAEVASRFEDVGTFVGALAHLGFKSSSKDLSNSFFYLLEFTKTGPARPGRGPPPRLKPCRYKRR